MTSNFDKHSVTVSGHENAARMLSLFYEILKTNSIEHLCELIIELLGYIIPSLTEAKRKKLRKILGV